MLYHLFSIFLFKYSVVSCNHTRFSIHFNFRKYGTKDTFYLYSQVSGQPLTNLSFWTKYQKNTDRFLPTRIPKASSSDKLNAPSPHPLYYQLLRLDALSTIGHKPYTCQYWAFSILNTVSWTHLGILESPPWTYWSSSRYPTLKSNSLCGRLGYNQYTPYTNTYFWRWIPAGLSFGMVRRCTVSIHGISKSQLDR